MTPTSPRRVRRVTAAVVLVTLIAGCGSGAQDEFAGDGWFQGRVLVCKTPGHCQQLHYPTPNHEPVYIRLKQASTGKPYGDFAAFNDGTFGWWAAPSTYDATLKPARLFGLQAGTARITVTANGRMAFDIAYGRKGTR